MGNITTSKPYQPMDSNNNVLTDWYVCTSLNEDSSIPDIDDKIVVISTSGYSTVDLNSSSIREQMDVESHAHTVETYTANIYTVGTDNNTYSTNHNISIGYTEEEKIYQYGSSSTLSFLPTQHYHGVDTTSYTMNNTITTTDLSNQIFKYINLYSIIYLPS